ncbi:MAG TPA: M24 family metallopeptidase [Gaiellales bacterium]|nr:M24 family metallopeptidase [Gaiellales bacterium]
MTTPLLIHADSLRDADMFVATGVPIVDAFTYLEMDGRRIIVASVLEKDVIERDSRATEIWRDDEFGVRELVREGWEYEDAAMERVRRVLERAGVSDVSVPPTFPVALADYLRGKDITVSPDRKLFEMRRRLKDVDQLNAIRQAQTATEASFRAARELLGSASPGEGGLVADGELVTCERVRDVIVNTLRAHGCEGEAPLVGAGPRGALVHDLGSGPIHPGEPIIIDVFPQDASSRYCADMTRTFCWGEAPERLKRMHATVLGALKRSTEAIAPGVPGERPWEIACDVIEQGGFRTTRGLGPGETLDEDFFHGLGHGVGVEVHEAPDMSFGAREPLLAGDVVTVEPGVYRKDFGGVRLEDLVVVTDNGHEVLTDFDYELEIKA